MEGTKRYTVRHWVSSTTPLESKSDHSPLFLKSFDRQLNLRFRELDPSEAAGDSPEGPGPGVETSALAVVAAALAGFALAVFFLDDRLPVREA